MVGWIQTIFDGIVFGSVILLGAVGVSFLYGIANVPNFAHGELMAIGAYITYAAATLISLPLVVAAAIGTLLTAAVGVALDRLLFKGRRQWTAVALLMLTLGISFVFRAGIRILWGTTQRSYELPLRRNVPVLDSHGTVFGRPIAVELSVNPYDVVIILIALGAGVIMYALLNYTRLGITIRAAADNRQLAKVAGVDTERIFLFVWAGSGAFAAIGGILLAVNTGVIHPRMGFSVLLIVFAAVILGGAGDFYGAIIGSYLVGIIHEAIVLVPYFGVSYGTAIVFAAMIVMLLIKPEGFTGGRHA